MRCGVFLSDVRTVGKTMPDQIKRLSSVKRKQSVPELVRRPVQRPPCVFLAYSGGFPVSRIHLRIIRQREQPVSYSCAQGLIRLQGHNISEADLMVEKSISRKKDFLGREIITERSRAMARNGDDRHVQSAEADHSGLQGLNPEITDVRSKFFAPSQRTSLLSISCCPARTGRPVFSCQAAHPVT